MAKPLQDGLQLDLAGLLDSFLEQIEESQRMTSAGGHEIRSVSTRLDFNMARMVRCLFSHLGLPLIERFSIFIRSV
jgi:hypothetical protein